VHSDKRAVIHESRHHLISHQSAEQSEHCLEQGLEPGGNRGSTFGLHEISHSVDAGFRVASNAELLQEGVLDLGLRDGAYKERARPGGANAASKLMIGMLDGGVDSECYTIGRAALRSGASDEAACQFSRAQRNVRHRLSRD
jgi:hypothetical protein